MSKASDVEDCVAKQLMYRSSALVLSIEGSGEPKIATGKDGGEREEWREFERKKNLHSDRSFLPPRSLLPGFVHVFVSL